MNEKVIACIPSKAMREFLTAKPIEMSVLQQATIVSEYADEKDRLPLFQILLEETSDESEKLLLSSAIKDIQDGNDFYSDTTQEIYNKHFPHYAFPLYPFLEVCGLPVLFKRGDVIRRGNKFYYVGSLPALITDPSDFMIDHCDFSDECYLCYDLSYPVKTENDLGLAHEHIHLCEAERASIKKLTPQQMKIYSRIRTLLRIMKLRKGKRKCRRMKKLSH